MRLIEAGTLHTMEKIGSMDLRQGGGHSSEFKNFDFHTELYEFSETHFWSHSYEIMATTDHKKQTKVLRILCIRDGRTSKVTLVSILMSLLNRCKLGYTQSSKLSYFVISSRRPYTRGINCASLDYWRTRPSANHCS